MSKETRHPDLTVMVKAKELCTYVLKVTERMEKKYRYTLSLRLQNMSMEIIEFLYLANEVYVTGQNKHVKYEERRQLQQKALARIKMLAYFTTLAMEHRAILMKQFAQISKLTSDCQNLIAAWIKSDQRRFGI